VPADKGATVVKLTLPGIASVFKPKEGIEKE
jgi:hypothetical protein